jgi:hypothetical protein
MAFRENSSQQLNWGDSTLSLTRREFERLQDSWAADFAEMIFPYINEARFAVLYSENGATRPNTPVNFTFALLLIKEMLRLTDEELYDQVLFNTQIQYALHTTSLEEQPISDRTLSRFRERCYSYELETGTDLIHDETVALAARIQAAMGVSGHIKRMDSLMVDISSRNMSRLQLFWRIVKGAVLEASRDADMAEKLTGTLRGYLEDSDRSDDIGYRLKDEEVGEKLQTLMEDAVALRELLPEGAEARQAFRVLLRLLEEQTDKADDGVVTLKEGKSIGADSLQSAVDEDATYREKAGEKHRGYVGNVLEATDDNGSVIVDYDLAPNITSDIQFSKDVISNLGEKNGSGDPDERTDTLITDGAYASAETVELAEDAGMELVSGTLAGRDTNPAIAEFAVDGETGEVLACPAGQAPTSSGYDADAGTHCAHFSTEACAGCPMRDVCISKEQKKSFVVRFSDKQLIRAEQQKKAESEEYQILVDKRNGVEGMPSVLRRKYGVDQIPVKGLVRRKFWFGMKIGAINVKRLVASRKNRRNDGGNSPCPAFSGNVLVLLRRQFGCVLPLFRAA